MLRRDPYCNLTLRICVVYNKSAKGESMKKLKILAVFLCVLLASTAWVQTETDTDENLSKQIKELKIQVEMLKKRIKVLEKQLQSLTRRGVVIPETFPKLDKIPEGWREYEFNGMKYYLVPVQAETKKINTEKK